MSQMLHLKFKWTSCIFDLLNLATLVQGHQASNGGVRIQTPTCHCPTLHPICTKALAASRQEKQMDLRLFSKSNQQG